MDSNEALIRQYLTSDDAFLRTLTCLKGCVRLYIETTTVYGKPASNACCDGFNRFDVHRMSVLAKSLLSCRMPSADDITWCTYAMPKYAKQLVKLSHTRNAQADKVELWLSNELQNNKFRYSKV